MDITFGVLFDGRNDVITVGAGVIAMIDDSDIFVEGVVFYQKE
jgi:hypothetical protein